MNTETASQPDVARDTALPLFYKSVVPLVDNQHGDIVVDTGPDYRFASGGGAVPLLAKEVEIAQAYYPIVFSVGADPIPLAIIGKPQGANRYVDDSGEWKSDTYIPAYVRRYPFILAKPDPSQNKLTLCIDMESSRVKRRQDKGNIFGSKGPSDLAMSILRFCEQFEAGARHTRDLIAEIMRLDLLIDGHAEVRFNNSPPCLFNGFQIVSDTKLRDLHGPEIAALVRSGAMALIYAHSFSLRHLIDLATDSLSDSGSSATADSQTLSAGRAAERGRPAQTSSPTSSEADKSVAATGYARFGKRKAEVVNR